jgi:hypothetical protein
MTYPLLGSAEADTSGTSRQYSPVALHGLPLESDDTTPGTAPVDWYVGIGHTLDMPPPPPQGSPPEHSVFHVVSVGGLVGGLPTALMSVPPTPVTYG